MQEALSQAVGADWVVTWADRLAKGLTLLARKKFDAALLDLSLPDARGLDSVTKVTQVCPALPIVVLTGTGSIVGDGSVQTLELGAQDFLVKGEATPAEVKRAIVYAIERKRQIEALRKAEERYRGLIRTLPDVVLTTQEDGRVSFVGPNVEAVAGISATDFLGADGHGWHALVHPEDRGLAERTLRDLFSRGSAECRLRLRRADGAWGHFHYRGFVTTREPGERVATGILRDVTAEERAAEARDAASRTFQALVGSLGAGLCGIDGDGRVGFVNPAACRMLGYQEAELVGASLHEKVHHSHPDGSPVPLAECAFQRVLYTGEQAAGDEWLVRNDGTFFPVRYTSAPVLHEGVVVGAVVSFQDDTERRAQVEALRAAHARLEELDKFRTQFVSQAAHELKNPLTPLNLQTFLLHQAIEEGDTASLKRHVDAIDAVSQRINVLIQDMLDAAKLQAGSVPISRQRVDLAPLLRNVCGSWAEIAKRAEVDLTSDIPGSLPCEVDSKRIDQVMVNLLGNAFKFTPKGGVVRVEARTEAGNVLVRVKDTGAGLTPEQASQLFRPFAQVHPGMAPKGSGLGLYICKGFVEQHGGRIGVESEGPGQGATFWFTVPGS